MQIAFEPSILLMAPKDEKEKIRPQVIELLRSEVTVVASEGTAKFIRAVGAEIGITALVTTPSEALKASGFFPGDLEREGALMMYARLVKQFGPFYLATCGLPGLTAAYFELTPSRPEGDQVKFDLGGWSMLDALTERVHGRFFAADVGGLVEAVRTIQTSQRFNAVQLDQSRTRALEVGDRYCREVVGTITQVVPHLAR